MNLRTSFRALMLLLVALAIAGCSGGGSSVAPNPPAARTGNVAVLGTDAPISSVLAFRITFTGLTFSGGTNTVSALSGSQEIEFARLNGLRTLLALQAVPVGTYTSVTATLSSPVISVLDTTVNPPAVTTINGTLSISSVTVNLPQPLVVTENDLTALLLDFRLRDSLQVNASGDITGAVVPTLAVRGIPPDVPDAELDDLRGGVVSVNAPAGSFVIQGPHGRNLTVDTNNQTHFEPDNESIATLDTDSIVQVSGMLQRSTLHLLASEITVISRERFLLDGLITDVRPSPGQADQIDLLIRTEIPDVADFRPGTIGTVPFNGDERFLIHRMQIPLASFLFNRSSLVEGQRVSVGGVLVTSTNPSTIDARRVVLQQQGLEGMTVPGSFNRNEGTFLMDVSGVTGRLFGAPVKVYTSLSSRFDGPGNSRLDDLDGPQPIRIRIVGLVLLDHSTNKPVIVGRIVSRLP